MPSGELVGTTLKFTGREVTDGHSHFSNTDDRAPFRDSRGGRGDSRQGASCPFVQGGRGIGRTDRPSRGRFTRPDRNDGPYPRTRYVMRAVVRVMSRLTAMSLRLPCSLRNRNGIYWMM